jgi:hypothetical protein
LSSSATTLLPGSSGSTGACASAWECAKSDCAVLVGCRGRYQDLQRKVTTAAASTNSSSSSSSSSASSAYALTSVGLEQRMGIHLLRWFLSEVVERHMPHPASLPTPAFPFYTPYPRDALHQQQPP